MNSYLMHDLMLRSQGYGRPVTPDEVLELIEEAEEYVETGEVLAKEWEEKRAELDARIADLESREIPTEEPDRPCGICCPGHARADGRCERHGRWIGDSPVETLTAERDALRAELDAAKAKLQVIADACGATKALEAAKVAGALWDDAIGNVREANETIERQRTEIRALTAPRRRSRARTGVTS